MKGKVVASLFAVGILTSLGAGYLVGTISQGARTSTSTQYALVPYTQTITVYSRSFTSTSCTYTTFPEELGCPYHWDEPFTVQVNYSGSWISSYQGYLGSESPSNITVAGSFYGHGPGSQSFTIVGWTPQAPGEILACAEAQKLDSSNSTLVLSFQGTSNAMNETSSPYGTAKFCLGVIIQ